MDHRRLRRLVLAATLVLGVTAMGATAGAQGLGDPHGPGQAGNPHAPGQTGNPHQPAGAPVVSAPATPAPAPVAAAPATTPSASPVAASVSASKADPPQTGKPADGTVGKANGKHPKGQSPNDKNKGYECDDNHGIGQGNPAHSGCSTTTSSTTSTSTTSTTATTLGPTTATTAGGTAVLGESFVRGAPAGNLPRTGGSDTVALVTAGLFLALIGGGLLWAANRRRAID